MWLWALVAKLTDVVYLQGKANIEMTTSKHNTPLLVAVCKGETPVIEFLVNKGNNNLIYLLWLPTLAIARATLQLYFAESLKKFFFRHTFSDVGKPTFPKLSHMTWLSIQQNLCYTDFFKVPLKRTGPKNPKFVPFFVPIKSRTISAVIL